MTTGEEGVRVGAESPTRGACTDDVNPYRTVIAIDLGYDTDPDAVVVYPDGA